ncbi:MAG TPA: ribosome biogenesis GTPase Der [Caulobacteraceae bacterium]|nr:ribosome biogenesis GTPase Der [Caulobacteraceae bacterium]
MPTIAIVGRPNVGKSTLFNRLAGRRLAIVHAQPGATRDVRSSPARLGDLAFDIVDTAGLEDVAGESLAARMRRQTEAAIGQADVAMFLIDAREGVTALDALIARQLRRGGKPVVLVANKAEGRHGGTGEIEAYELGLGEAVPISAEHGEGLAQLHGALAAALDTAQSGPEAPGERPMRIAIIGRPNAGKSTLANRLLGDERLLTGPEPGITRDAIEVDFSFEGRAFRLVDTAGLRRKAKVVEGLERLAVRDALRALTFAEVVLLVMDATHPFETQDLQLADLIEREGRAIIFVLSKWDLVADPSERRRALVEQAAVALPQLRGAWLAPLSAETGEGMAALMPGVVKAHADWAASIKTPALNEWLRLAVERNPPPAVAGRRPKLKYAAQTKSRPPTIAIFATRAAQVPDSYRRYLVNSLRESFDLPGTPIRLQLRASDNPYAAGSRATGRGSQRARAARQSAKRMV